MSRIANSFPKRYRARVQRSLMNFRACWTFLWDSKPADLLFQGVATVCATKALLVFITHAAPYLWALAVAWGVFLSALAIARYVTLRFWQ